jgi:hypothetical protein
MVSIEALAGGRVVEVAITTLGPEGTFRVVSVLGYKLDLIPGKYVFIQKYEDKPGQLGKIGTILGNHGINISTMEVGVREENLEASAPKEKVGAPKEKTVVPKEKTVMALILMNVDEPVPPEVRAEIKEAVGVTDGWFIQL